MNELDAKIDEYIQKWEAIGTCTDPIDFELAKEAAKLAYKISGEKVPTQFYYAKGPTDAIRIIQEIDPSMSSRQIYSDMLFGYSEAYWLAFYDFVSQNYDVNYNGELDGLIALAKTSGWLNVYEDVVVIQDRPEIIKFDEENRLHGQTGPAIRFRDGFEIYVWHGVNIPDEWIKDPRTLTPEIALTWSNIEQRRCACEILGWSKILNSLKAKVINTDDDPEIGQLVEVELPEIGKEKFLRVMCGTGREFALPVPPEMKTALEANAWTFNLPADMLKGLEVRT